MDSKLVVEQMSGRWKIKHPDMVPLATAAHRLAPFGATFTWIPRERNKHADRILNDALDAAAGKAPRRPAPAPKPVVAPATGKARPAIGPPGTATTLLLVRHGVTEHTTGKRFSGGLSGRNPGLSEDGRAQARATADWIAPLADEIDVLVSSPVRRAAETAQIIGERLDKLVRTEDGLAEMEFGAWDGLTFEEVREKYADDLDAWLGSMEIGAGGGESFSQVQDRVHGALQRLLEAHAGQTVLVVSHVTPIKVVVAHALGAPLDAVHRMELAPASLTVVSFYDDGHASMRMFNARPMEEAFIGR
jgi:ribonuclease H / adenosylcobalamin/alpha-ribazole phosphatase